MKSPFPLNVSPPLTLRLIGLLLLALSAPLRSADDPAPAFPPLPFNLKPGQSLAHSKNWVSLDETGEILATRIDKQIALTLRNNARFRSSDVAAYPESLTLKARWQISDHQGAMGFGWIDFSTSHYYYLYEDATRQQLILQRGDGTSTKQLALHPLPASALPRTVSLTRTLHGNGEIHISILVNGEKCGEPVIDHPGKEAGSTFQIYVGSGNDAVVTLYAVSTIPATSRQKSSGWFW